MSIVAIVYGLLLMALFEFGLYVMLIGVVGIAVFLVYKNIMAIKRRNIWKAK